MREYCDIPFNCLGLVTWRMEFQMEMVFCRSDSFALSEKKRSIKKCRVVFFSSKSIYEMPVDSRISRSKA